MITIILPVFNEENAIGRVIDEIQSAMRQTEYPFEILIVDDASEDQTTGVAESKGIRFVQHTRNRGAGASVKTGIEHARGEIVVTMDADGSYSARNIPDMLRFIPEYDQVIGVRSKEYGPLRFLRGMVKKLFFFLASSSSGYAIPDLNSGLRIFKKEVMLPYVSILPDGFSYVSTMTLTFLYKGHSVKFTPIDYRSRIGKSNFNIFKDTLRMLRVIINTRIKYRKDRA